MNVSVTDPHTEDVSVDAGLGSAVCLLFVPAAITVSLKESRPQDQVPGLREDHTL